MTWLVEDRWTIIIGTAIVALLMTIIAWKTGRSVLLLATVGVALVGGLLVLIEWLVVTDRETVYDTIDQIAAAVEANDLAAMSEFISTGTDAAAMPHEVRAAMASRSFREIHVSRERKIVINRHTSPPKATATFTAWAQLGEFRTPPQKVKLTFRLEGDRWRVTKFSYGPIGKL
jgi:hypothetical protein